MLKAVDHPDACRAAGAGLPSVVLGGGEHGYEPLDDGQLMKLEKGPQGGHHLWFSLRTNNVKRRGTKISLQAVQPETSLTVPPTAFVLDLDPVVDGSCEVHGLRYQLDNGAADYRAFWGKRLDVTAEVRDAWGRSATITRAVQVASGD